ncbi:MAG: Fis family transcriptional regulator [Rhodospirillaceae bacterium]|nr:Fis family transcriptional regulator [Rhodospirillaceae bacterium]|tara:strand:- start:9550 stop:11343 length:1794 start_codon:yes stop_codon:yes gene_type:complete
MNERYKALFRKGPTMSVVVGEDGCFLDASDTWLQRFGYTRSEITNYKPQDLASSAAANRIVEDYLPLLRRTGRLYNVPVDIRTKSGKVIECLADAVVEREVDGRYLETVAVYSEVGESDQIEQHYQDLYRDTPAMMHTIDSQARIVHVSDRWLMKLGYQREDVIGRNVTDFMAEDSGLDQNSLIDIIAQGDLDNEPRRYITKTGDVVEVLVSSHADREENGDVKRMYVALKDVTERNIAERKLRTAFQENERLQAELEQERDYLREEVHISMNFGRIIGQSQALKKMLTQLEAVAQTTANVLIQGESGVGKELIAHAIHAQSTRSSGPLVKVNCASIPHELFESEFFGHVKGAFTGAHRDRIGRFQLADGGTLFLDEISEIPLDLQSKLLRVLQESEYEKVGDDKTQSVDVRVVAATNRDLETEVELNEFREDLYYRLSVFPILVPPLRDRDDDVVQLATHFLEKICHDFGQQPLTLSRKQADLLKKYEWPGNVRELNNIVERAVILSKGKVVRLDLAMADILNLAPVTKLSDNTSDEYAVMKESEIIELGKKNMIAALKISNWRVSGPSGAAQLIGLKPSTFADRMKKFGIDRSSV